MENGKALSKILAEHKREGSPEVLPDLRNEPLAGTHAGNSKILDFENFTAEEEWGWNRLSAAYVSACCELCAAFDNKLL